MGKGRFDPSARTAPSAPPGTGGEVERVDVCSTRAVGVQSPSVPRGPGGEAECPAHQGDGVTAASRGSDPFEVRA